MSWLKTTKTSKKQRERLTVNHFVKGEYASYAGAPHNIDREDTEKAIRAEIVRLRRKVARLEGKKRG
jgi:hypothetical protein